MRSVDEIQCFKEIIRQMQKQERIGIDVCNVSVNSNWVHPPGQPPGLAQKTCPGGRDLAFKSCPGTGNSTRAGIL